MSELPRTAETRTGFDCETAGLPAERWGEAVFKIRDEAIATELRVEKEILGAIMIDKAANWKGTLAGLRQRIKDANAGHGARNQ